MSVNAVGFDAVSFDAIVLTGGRSSRLGMVPKSEFVVDGTTLLERTLAAVSGAGRIVVVGPQPQRPLPSGVLLTREDPPFSGPVAGIAAGLARLAEPAALTVLLACDMPFVACAVADLVDELAAHEDADGVLAVDSRGRHQPLAAVYRTAALQSAVDSHRSTGSLAGMPVFRLIDSLTLVPVAVPEGATSDVDTWDDATTLHATAPTSLATKGLPMNDDEARALNEFAERLQLALGLDDVDVNVDAILGLAGEAAHAVVRPAAPVTTFLVGYAAGLAAGGGVGSTQAISQAAAAARGSLSAGK